MVQLYKIAGLVVAMDTFGRTLSQAEPYRIDEAKPDIVIPTDWRMLKKELPHFSDEDCEYVYSGSIFYSRLLDFNGFMLHSSAVVVDGKAYLFSAHSGTGKSTHTSLWMKKFGERAYMLNDDKPALRLEDGKWYAYGTPWSGKFDINTNARVPIAGICFLERGEENRIRPFMGSAAVVSFFEQTVRPAEKEQREKILNLLSEMLQSVPIWKLSCNMNPEAADVAYEAMSASVL